MRTKHRAACGLLALSLAGTGCSHGGDEATPTPLVEVQAAPVRPGPIEQWIRGQAVLYPLRQAIVTPKISAPVSRFFVNRGDPVHAGEVVAQLENRDLKAAAAQAQGQLEAAQAAYATATAGAIPADLEKAQLDAVAAQQAFANAQKIYDSRTELFRQGALPRRDLDQANVDLTNAKNASELAQQHLEAMESVEHAQALKAAQGDLDTAQAQAAAAAAQLGYSEIESPIDGVVTDRPAYPGELATSAAPLMTIMDLADVVARVPLPADQTALLRVGDQATITAPEGGAPLPAHVTVVSPATDAGSTTIEVWVQAQNPGGRLRPGTSVNVAILVRTLAQALTVPASALLTDPSGATSVMLVGADGKAHQASVNVGIKDAGQIQILTGLKPGDIVVTVGAYGLTDQTLIKVMTPAAVEP